MKPGIWFIVVLIMLTMGCQGFQGDKVRQDHVESYPDELVQGSQRIMAEYPSLLTLEDCIHLAMAHGLAVKRAELQQRMARMDKNISWSNFLPAVSLDIQQTWWDPNPMISFDGRGVAMHDKDVRDITWNIQVPILNPAVWFLHGMVNRGYEIAALANDYVRQAITFQIIGLFYQCLSLEQMVDLTQAQLTAVQTQAKEFSAWQKEGLIPEWQAKEAQARVLGKSAELRQRSRALEQIRAELNIAMGLAPDTALKLKEHMPLQMPEQTLEDIMTEALLNHPNLAIADRKVAIEKDKIKVAISGFLPSLNGFASHIDISDSHQKYSNYWMQGLVGTISLFNGFANINQYRLAKLQQEDAFIQREQETLALMVQVIRACHQAQNAREMMTVASALADVAEARMAETKDRYDNDMIRGSELLTAMAKADKARVDDLLARFQHQISIAALLNVMGRANK